MERSVKHQGNVSAGQPGLTGTAEYNPPPSRPLQIFLFCAFLVTAVSFIAGQRSDFESEDAANRLHDVKLHRLVVDNGKYMAYTKLGFRALEQNRPDAAVTNFRSAVRLEESGEAHFNLANALMKAGQTNEAVKEFHAAWSLDPKLKLIKNKGSVNGPR